MRKELLFLLLVVFTSNIVGQTVIFTEDFDDATQYTVTIGAEGNDGTADYFQRTDGSDININYSGANGSNFFAGQDINDGGWTGSASPSELTWSSINIAGYTNLSFSGLFASAATSNIDAGDYIHVQYQIDGGDWINLIWFENDDGSNTYFLEDTDFDGTGEGTQLTSTFSRFTKNISGTGNLLDIRITVDLDADGEDFAIDLFTISKDVSLPTAETGGTTNISETSATITGTVNDNGANTTINFQWGTSSGSYTSGGDADPASIVAGTGSTSVTKNITGLTTGTTYYYRVVATNSVGTSYGIEKSFVAEHIPDLIINEIMQNPDAVADSDGEWFEIYNNESVTVDIDGYIIKDNDSDSHTISNGGALNISAGGFIVLGINSDNTTNGGLTVDYQYSGFTLTNTGDEIVLVHSNGTSVVDKVEYDGGTNFPAPTGATMILTNLSKDNNVGSNWSTSTVREGSWGVGGAGDKGSPGEMGSETVLPVELTSFTAKQVDGGVLLNWSTATEVNNYGFEIERSSLTATPVETWETIGFVEGHGNSNSPNEYSYFDNLVSGSVSYRLKQIDFDGELEYSDVVTVSANLVKTELYQNHPNPFNPTTQISFSVATQGKVTLTVYNLLGEKIATLVNENMVEGNHVVDFNASNLSSGFYFYHLKTSNYSKTMKMILLK